MLAFSDRIGDTACGPCLTKSAVESSFPGLGSAAGREHKVMQVLQRKSCHSGWRWSDGAVRDSIAIGARESKVPVHLPCT